MSIARDGSQSYSIFVILFESIQISTNANHLHCDDILRPDQFNSAGGKPFSNVSFSVGTPVFV
jgi:hypothetical protein